MIKWRENSGFLGLFNSFLRNWSVNRPLIHQIEFGAWESKRLVISVKD